MNGSAQNVGPCKKRNQATPAVAPITRAIRAALAVSATALALSSPVVSLAAGTGRYDVTNTYTCHGAFSQALPDASLVPPVDLTVVPGDQSPTSVNSAAALAGIDAVCAGDVSAIAYVGTSIDTSGVVDALDVGSVDDVTLVGGGDAFADVIDANAFSLSSDISMGNRTDGTFEIGFDGVINADSFIDGFNGIAAAAATSLAVDNNVDISVSGYGNVVGLDVFDAYSARLYNNADITAEAALDAYGLAFATGARVSSVDAAVFNHGDISATAYGDGYSAWARGIDSFGYSVGSTVHNDGDIQAIALANDGTARAFGVYSFGYAGSSTVDNSGNIQAVAQAAGGRAYATAINSIGYGLDADVTNTGSIFAGAAADYAYALSIVNFATRQSGSAHVANDGTISADAHGNFATATGVINAAFRYGSAITTNADSIDATAYGASGASATGIYNYAYAYDAIVDNSGSISAMATATTGAAFATGVYNESINYANTRNAGSISASADGVTGMSAARGVVAKSDHFADVANEADSYIDVVATSQDGYALAIGAYAIGGNTTTLTNYGSISARSSSVNGDATAYAAVVNGGYAGIGLLINGGDLSADASVAAGGDAYATGAFVYADVATIFNDGSTSASATTVDGQAVATGLGTYGNYSAISNYGDLTASAAADGGTATAVGADSFGYLGSSFYNAGTIHATASAVDGEANAIGASSIGYIFSAYATNVAGITAEATGYDATATGLLNASAYIGDAITTNTGDISAVANGVMSATAVGAYNFAYVYDSIVDNSGSIQATAVTSYYQATAVGAHARGVYGYGDASVINSGSIAASASAIDVPGFASASAWGAVSQNGPYALSEVRNEAGGSISASAFATADFSFTYATGAYAQSVAGQASIVNYGDIGASSVIGDGRGYAYATGAQALAVYMYSEAAIANHGAIESFAQAYSGFAVATGVANYGYHSTTTNAADATITAVAYTELFGSAAATGIEAGAKYGASVVNDGSIVAYAKASHGFHDPATGYNHFGVAGATGIQVYGGTFFTAGDGSVVNNGDITAIAIAEDGITFFNAGAGASGIRVNTTHDAFIENAGNITAIADSELGVAGAYGVAANGRSYSQIINHAGATISASATVGTVVSDYYAGRAAAMGAEVFGAFDGYIYNAGSIVAYAAVTPDGGQNPSHSIASAFGVEMRTHNTGELVNVGDIHAAASADFGYASAYGVRMPGNQLSSYSNNLAVTIDNAGIITAHADADYGNAFAVGAYAYASHQEYLGCGSGGCYYAVTGGDAKLDNHGDISAVASAHGGVGYSYGAIALGAYAAGITNAGHITAITEADDALAVGSLANSFYGDALLQNSGIISAVATGDIANASGAVVLGAYGAQVNNDGTIAAAAYGADATATAVSMESNGNNVLTNTGTIAAFGDGTRIAISSGSGATASIANSGSITGAILTGDLDDNLDNAAGSIWHAVGESDFGAGDDHIVNHGTILMDDAVIRLGGYVTGNTFDNFGTLAVSGAANVLDMDNPFPVNNNGVITFVDGAADDVLTIVGDFAGQGDIQVDVSGLNQTSDQLYVEGGVIAPTTQTLNVNLLDMPTTASMYVPLVYVNGESTADDFVLGNVGYGGGFLSLDFSLNANIDASNATADVFSLGVAVTGLSDMGSLAATIAPGVQSLVNAQVGTWRQRMGVVPEAGDVGLAPWVRMFTDSGDVNPQHSSNFGPGGNFGFKQSNHGWELGLDARPTENFAVGVLFADLEGSQHLRTGAGSDRFDGKTFGLYGTLLAKGFYVDVSQRWTGLDARLQSAVGTQTTEVSANAFNVEAGYTAWTVADIHVVPQAQYTRTEVSDISTLQSGQSTFVVDGGVSSRARLGVALDKTFERAGYTWTPYGSLNAVREFDGEYDYSVNGGLVGATSTEGTSAMVEMGLGMRKGKLSITGGVNWIDGGAVQSFMGGQLAMRYSW
ncbi:hypothetical protein [Lysobacter sp. CFH 32150]|uniref:hypothetical protein n=1 Tax=Lysobacter sp. CFH 32150 TaxID=2927128 RepID=UPI001FA6C23E|nr:hypothetical protein [Lysobacter sp. CFH 32150]MCI4568312.1 hypothetical protein [Lysobacter sp. CFH 32150]